MKFIVLLLLLFAAGLPGQAETIRPLLSKAGFDSLRTRLQHSRPDTSRVRLLLQLAQDVMDHNEEYDTDFSAANAYCQQAFKLSETLHFTMGHISSLYALGQYHELLAQDTLGPGLIRQGIALSQRLGNRRLEAFGWYRRGEMYARDAPALPMKIATFQRARALFRQVADKQNEAYLLKCIADMHQLQGHSEPAIRELLEAVALYQAVGYRRMHYPYDLLGVAYRQMGDYKEALRYSVAALESARAMPDTSAIGGFYSRLAVVYRELKQYPEALFYYQKALASFQQSGNALHAVTMAGSMSRIMVAQHRAPEALAFIMRVTKPYAAGPPRVTERIADYIGSLHVALGHYALAEPYYEQLRAYLRTGTADDLEKMAIYQTLGTFYLLTQRYDTARRYLQQAMALNLHTRHLLSIAELHRLLFRADSAQGRFPAAIAHYQRYKLLNDSIFNEKKNQQFASLQIQYDTHKKEQNIALLTRQTQVQQARIQQREWQRNATLAGLGMLVLLLGISYNRYRLKQRSNHLLEAQKLEINQKNQSLERVVEEKNTLLNEKEELLGEKEWMLKEIHHRVKNNLQIVSSLLNTQAKYLHDPEALAAIQASKNRVLAMALIHQKLHQSESLARVNMPEYTQEIVDYLLASFDRRAWVTTRLDLSTMELNVALATPIGLIINEAVTNALKHAFPGNRRGTITIGLAQPLAQHYELTIADDGVGWPPGFDLSQSRTLGITIIQGLSEQVHGVLTFPPGEGVRLRLQFEVAPRPNRNGVGSR